MASGRGPRAPTPRANRLASLCFGIGCLVVLVVTFTLGVAAGRRWPSGLPLPGLGGAPAATAAAPAATAGVKSERDTARRAEGRSLDKGKTTTDAPPVLTFYRELTAPLTPPTPPTRGVVTRDVRPAETVKLAETTKPAQRPAETVRPVTSDASAVVEAPPRETVAAAVAAGASGASASVGVSGPRFTVQVGAFRGRAQAEALRARLAERGQDVDLTEGEATGVTQYRVRVGTFATRAAAREAAARLGAERQLATYVTTR